MYIYIYIYIHTLYLIIIWLIRGRRQPPPQPSRGSLPRDETLHAYCMRWDDISLSQYVYVYIYIYMYIHMCMCMHIYIYIYIDYMIWDETRCGETRCYAYDVRSLAPSGITWQQVLSLRFHTCVCNERHFCIWIRFYWLKHDYAYE